jgi:hypothetical protein
MNKTQSMSQARIESIPVETVLYGDPNPEVALIPLSQFPSKSLVARYFNQKSCYYRPSDPSTIHGKAYVWTLREDAEGRQMAGRQTRHLLNTTAEHLPIRPIDVHALSRQFFEIKKPEEGLQLFAKYGVFGDENRNLDDCCAAGLSFAELIEWQALLKKCWLNDPSAWEAMAEQSGLFKVREILEEPRLSIGFGAPIRMRLSCHSVRDAILAAVYLDKLANIRSSMCHRPDCGIVFNHKSKHKRIYCSSDCAHLEAVRNSRKQKAGK